MIGRLRQRVKIQTVTKTENYKGVAESWADIETRWAAVLDLSKQEQELYQQFGAPEDLKKIVFKGEVSLAVRANRFVYNSTTYEMIDRQEIQSS